MLIILFAVALALVRVECCDKLVYRDIRTQTESVYRKIDSAGSFFLAPMMTQNSCNGVPIYKKEGGTGEAYYMFKANEQRDTDYMCEMFVPSNVVACQAECEEVRFKMANVYVNQRDRNGVQGAMPEEFDATFSSWRPKVMDRIYCADQIEASKPTDSVPVAEETRFDATLVSDSQSNNKQETSLDSSAVESNSRDSNIDLNTHTGPNTIQQANSDRDLIVNSANDGSRISTEASIVQSQQDRFNVLNNQDSVGQSFDRLQETTTTTTEQTTTTTSTIWPQSNGLNFQIDQEKPSTVNQESEYSSFTDLSPFQMFQIPTTTTTTTTTQRAAVAFEDVDLSATETQRPQIQNTNDRSLIDSDSLSSFIFSNVLSSPTTTTTTPAPVPAPNECDRISFQILERGEPILNFTLVKYFGVSCTHGSMSHLVYYDPAYDIYLFRNNHAHYCLDKLEDFTTTDNCQQACKDLRLGPMGLMSPLETEFIVVLNDHTILSDDYKISCIEEDTSVKQSACASEPCLNGATCSEADNSHGFICSCKDHYTGFACQTYDYEPCQNKKFGELAPHEEPGMFYVCLGRRSGENIVHRCPAGLVYNDLAQRCEYNDIQSFMDESQAKCTINICQNGGLCEVVDRQIKCMCPVGFSGDNCEINTDDCKGKCGSNGRCVDLINGWVCLCDDDTTYGSDCVVNKIPNPCRLESLRALTSTTRDLKLTRHFYQFDPSVIVECSFSGEIHLNRCPSNLFWDPITARCIYHYQTLSQKQIEDMECHDVVCFNGGKCNVNSITLRPQCDCPIGFKGDFCELNINECASNPCDGEQAECVDLINDYYCVCTNKFLDKDCQAVSITKNPCTSVMKDTRFTRDKIVRYPHPFTKEKFIVCNLEGYAQVLSCPAGLVWMQNEHTCGAQDQQILLIKERQCNDARSRGINMIAYHYSMFKYVECQNEGGMIVRNCPKETPLFCAIKQACVKHYLIDCLFKPTVI